MEILKRYFYRTIASLPADDMVWFVFQVLRSSETEFNKNQRKDILEKMTQIFSFELDPFSIVLNNIWIDYFGKKKINKNMLFFGILKRRSEFRLEKFLSRTFGPVRNIGEFSARSEISVSSRPGQKFR